MVTKSLEIEPIKYSGSVAGFRAWMDRFLARNGTTFKGTWEGHPLEYEIGYFSAAQTTTREVWNVYIRPEIIINGKRPGDSHLAMILATEEMPNVTIVEFIDGRCYERTSQPISRSSNQSPIFGNAHLAIHNPIGGDFIKIAEWITEELSKSRNSLIKVDVPKLLSDAESESQRKENVANIINNIYIGGDVEGNVVAGNENEVENTTKSTRKRKS